MSSDTKTVSPSDPYSDMDARLDALLAEISANVHEVKSIMREKKEQAGDKPDSPPEGLSQMEDGILQAADRICEEEAAKNPEPTDNLSGIPQETKTAPTGTADESESGDDEYSMRSSGWMAKRRLLKEKKGGAQQESRADLQKMDIIDFDNSDLPEFREPQAAGADRRDSSPRAASRQAERIQEYRGQPLNTARNEPSRAKTADVDGILDDIKADSAAGKPENAPEAAGTEKPENAPETAGPAKPAGDTGKEPARENEIPATASSAEEPVQKPAPARETPAPEDGTGASSQVPVSMPSDLPADGSIADVGKVIGQFLEYSNEFIKLQSAIIKLNDSVIDHQNELIQMKGEASAMIEKYNQMFDSYRVAVQRMSNS